MDAERASQLYRGARAAETIPKSATCANLINLLTSSTSTSTSTSTRASTPTEDAVMTDGAGDGSNATGQQLLIALAFAVYEDMKAFGVAINEAVYTALVKALSATRRCDKALALVQEMRANGLIPRPRTATPLLKALSASGRVEDCFALYTDMATAFKITPCEADYVSMLRATTAANDGRFYQVRAI